MSEDPKISGRYRGLGREEPPRELDAKILAAARRAVETRPAPLVVPSGRRRWYFPLAAAAIIVLAVAVTMHVEREQPDPETAVPPVTAPKAERQEEAPPQVSAEAPQPVPQRAPARKAAPPTFTPDPKPQPSPESAVSPQVNEMRAQRDAAPAAPQAAPAPAPAAAQERARQERAAAEVRESRRADAARSMARLAPEPPEKWLERIAELRKEERHDEADKALAEFRRTYPDYRISEAMLDKVEKK